MTSTMVIKLSVILLVSTISLTNGLLTESASFSNRSKIHITVDVDSKDSKITKDISQGVSKNEIKIDDKNDDVDDNDEDDDNDDDNEVDNGDNEVEHGRKKEVGHDKHSFRKGNKIKPKQRDAKSVASWSMKHKKKSKPKTNKKRKSKKGKKASKKKRKADKKKKNDKKKKKKDKKRKFKSRAKKGNKHKNQGRKKKGGKRKGKRKNEKYVPNPEGSPNPHNLKIPLTFMREDIHNETMENKTNTEQSNDVSLVNGDKPKSDGIDTSKSGATAPDSNPNFANDSDKKAANKIRDITKQIVIATLKQVKEMSGNKTSFNGTQVQNNLKPTNPLLERMVSTL